MKQIHFPMEENSRRDFLRKMLFASVFTVASPHILLGKIIPEIKVKDDKILGSYLVDLNAFPMLRNLWGSVRMDVTVLTKFPKIIVTKVPKKTYHVDYTCIEEICPHEGHWVKDLDPVFHDFVCTGHGSVFDADGSYIQGPAAQDLTKHKVTIIDANTLSVDISKITTIAAFDEIISLSYMKQNYPNPCSNQTTIYYGIEKPGNVQITLYSLEGNEVKKIIDEHSEPGHFYQLVDVSDLPVGNYFYKMTVDSRMIITQKLAVVR